MPDNKNCCKRQIREAVCIDTDRVYDSCADKDCLADLRVYFTANAQQIINEATNIRCRGAEILNAFIEVERVPFNRGCYSVDVTFFFRVTLDVFTSPTAPPTTVCGLSTYSKKCILYGSEGDVKVFSSEYTADEIDEQLPVTNTNPKAKVQTVDPICLDARLCPVTECCDNLYASNRRIPASIRRCFNGEITLQADRAVAVTLGLFTIIQLERDVQMLIPAYDFCIPDKECTCETDDPCETFRKIDFPINEFFPPNERDLDRNEPNTPSCGCGS